MSTLSTDTQVRIATALGSAAAGAEAVAAIADGTGAAAKVAVFAGTTNIPSAACAGGSTPTAAQVNTAIDTCNTTTESRLDNIETKINAILTALTNAGLMVA